jgi:rhodanese-related sulfurtransferase
VLGVAAAILLGAAQPAAPPDYPTAFIRVDELKADLDRGAKIDIIDVRGWDQYSDMHIKNARSMPIRSIEARAPKEITRTGRVVFY